MDEGVPGGRAYERFTAGPGLSYYRPRRAVTEGEFAREVSASLGRDPKSIPPKFFYDRRGSGLFERICSLPEYYPARTEISLLGGLAGGLPGHLDGGFRLVELGSGSSVKTRLLIDALGGSQWPVEYFPIDVSEVLEESSRRLIADYDGLSITGIVDTYEAGMEFLGKLDDRRNLVAFLGSSYGNFLPADGAAFLGALHSAMGPGDLFLIGLDMVKDAAVLEAAYDDPLGVTAEFNLNVLSRMNRELGADFDLGRFEHHSTYNAAERRIEMYVRSLADQSVRIPACGMTVRLGRGELIHTEYSYKFTPGQVRSVLRGAGFGVRQTWRDRRGYFSLTLASRD